MHGRADGASRKFEFRPRKHRNRVIVNASWLLNRCGKWAKTPPMVINEYRRLRRRTSRQSSLLEATPGWVCFDAWRRHKFRPTSHVLPAIFAPIRAGIGPYPEVTRGTARSMSTRPHMSTRLHLIKIGRAHV